MSVYMYKGYIYGTFCCSLDYVCNCSIDLLSSSDCCMQCDHNLSIGGRVMMYEQKSGCIKVILVHCHSFSMQNTRYTARYLTNICWLHGMDENVHPLFYVGMLVSMNIMVTFCYGSFVLI